jgi:hypothetical protein
MSSRKEELKFCIGELVKIDYSPELKRKKELNERQTGRNNRLAIVLNVIEKEEIKDFNSIGVLYRYEVMVGKEIIEIDQSCLLKVC